MSRRSVKTADSREIERRSLWQATVAFLVGVGYLVWLGNAPQQGLEMLAHFFLATFVCGPFALVFGVLAIRNGRRVYRESKVVLLWLVPMCLVFLLPLMAFVAYATIGILASQGVLVR